MNRFKGIEIIKLDNVTFVNLLTKGSNSDIGSGQKKAWLETYKFIIELLNSNQGFRNVDFIFEYELPLTNAKRPDILIFVRNELYILEYKNKVSYAPEDVSQLKSYYDTIVYYHSEGMHLKVKPILILNSNKSINETIGNISIVSQVDFINVWSGVQNIKTTSNVNAFLNASYKASKDILSYFHELNISKGISKFTHQLLENSSLVSNRIERIIKETREKQTHSLILVSGEPGSGKTALGLKMMKEYDGSFISKNKKFLELFHSEFGVIPNMHKSSEVIYDFLNRNTRLDSNVIIVDEAQRALAAKKIREYYNSDISEHEIIMHQSFNKKWSCTIVFIGLGQTLGVGEVEEGDKWVQSFFEITNGLVYSSEKLGFTKHDEKYYHNKLLLDPDLHLGCSIRTNSLDQYSNFVDLLLYRSDSIELKKMSDEIKRDGLLLKVTRDINKAKEYVNLISNTYPNRSISSCIIGSSSEYDDIEDCNDVFVDYKKSDNCDISNIYNNSTLEILSNHDYNLTQYHAIGLEFDLPIVAWNADFKYYKEKWNFPFHITIAFGTMKRYYRNAYRVFLTRGRLGTIVYIPKHWSLNETYRLLLSAGFDPL